MNTREPLLKPLLIAELRPTQMTVGQREVDEKRRRWREVSATSGDTYLGRHMIPSVLGPKSRHYIIDNHHLARALYEEGVKEVLVTVTADLSSLPKVRFWTYLDNVGWCHPYDDEGRRKDFDDIPTAITGLKDDPYRSLAGDVRHGGGFAKDVTPFSEFLWADFLRGRIKRKAVDKDYPAALRRALKLAKSQDAAYLPGWSGPDPIA